MTAPGWYNAEGDPPGTTRYWDGERWVGDPVQTSITSPASVGFGRSGQLNLASPGSRIGARFIDLIIALVVGAIFLIPVITGVIDDLDDLGSNPTDTQVERVITDAVEDNISTLVIFGIAGLLWDFVWVGLFGGTPGKLIVGLRVARADNGAHPPGWAKAALRALNRLIGLVPGIGGLIVLLVGLISLIMLFSDSQNRTIMDRVASTVVLKK
jgi:uncharacterized RDD family membrane protein YckC